MTPAKMGAGFPLCWGRACGWMFIACSPRPRNLCRNAAIGRCPVVDVGGAALITISHCYNGINGASTGDCGVTNAHPAEGSYDITFDFIVADRFIQVTPEFGTTGDGSIVLLLASFRPNSNRTVQVHSYHPPTEGGPWYDSRKDTGFWLTIY